MIHLALVKFEVPKSGRPEAALAGVVGAISVVEAVWAHLLRDQKAGLGGGLVDERCRDYMIQVGDTRYLCGRPTCLVALAHQRPEV